MESSVIFDALNTFRLNKKSTGFLYGLSEPNVPSVDLLQGVAPNFVVQKVLGGMQHPTGDVMRVSSVCEAVGIEHIQVYLQDMYLEWPYEEKGTLEETLADYYDRVIDVLKKMQDITGDPALKRYNFVPFNEPDAIWFKDKPEELRKAWKELYRKIKEEVHPNIKIAFPPPANFSSKWVRDFLKYAYENNCLPDVIAWHELFDSADVGNSLVSFRSHWNEVQQLIREYYTLQGFDEPIVVVNEYALFEDIGVGGALLRWLAMFEEAGIYACLAYWGLANTLNELAADNNVPNSAWWLYKWYKDLTGERMAVTTRNARIGGIYGIGSIDEQNRTAYIIFGGQDGIQRAYVNKLADTGAFKNARSVYVKLYKVSYSGHHGPCITPYVYFEGNLPLNDGSLKIQVSNCNEMDVYYAVIHPATSEKVSSIETYNRIWTATYEAEDAVIIGNAWKRTYSKREDLARSGRADVEGIWDTTDGVEFIVSVPKNGKYELKVFYSVPAPYVNPITLEIDPNGQNRAVGQLVKHQLFVNGEPRETLVYDSTVKQGYINYARTYVDLRAGENRLKLMHHGENQSNKHPNIRVSASIDKIELVYNTEYGGEVIVPDIVIQPEEIVRENENYVFDNKECGFTGGGYVKGRGDFSFTVIAPEDGLYDVELLVLDDTAADIIIKKQIVDFGKDARTGTPISTRDIVLGKADERLSIHLTKGANTITIFSDREFLFDAVIFKYNKAYTLEKSMIIEAEDAVIMANVRVIENEYASGGKMVDGITIGQDPESVSAGAVAQENRLVFEVEVEKAGYYALSMFYSNNEPAPVMPRVSSPGLYVHPYNTDLVERYAQIVVNDNEPETVYFRNTLSWDTIKNMTIYVELKSGRNTIVIYNDNSYQFSKLVNSAAPRFDKFIIAPAVLKKLV
jgi:hypothetical protein